jgi:hypothetical protein
VTLADLGSYGQWVISAVALTSAILFIVAGLAWTARLVHVGNLDAQALADKIGSPEPSSALDWPELHLHAVIAQPDEQSVVLLHVGWPAYPQRKATLLVALDQGDRRSLSLLSQWCTCAASVAPVRRDGAELELRRRQSLERVHAVLMAEDFSSGR